MNKIGIFGVPRSGTSWLAHIFNSHPDVALRFQPLFSYGHKGALSENSSPEEIRGFFDEILHTTDPFALMKADMQSKYPEFRKSDSPTHIVFKETRYLHIIENMLVKCPEVRLISIVRNPMAVLASWVKAPREYKPEWDIHEEWRDAPGKNQGKPEEYYGFNKWKQFALDCLRFRECYSTQFLLVRYGDLNDNPAGMARKIFSFCDLSFPPEVEAFIKESKSRHDADPYSVYRSEAGGQQWKTVLPEEIVSQIEKELSGTALEGFL